MKRVDSVLAKLRSTARCHGEPDVRLGPQTVERLEAELERLTVPRPASIGTGDLVMVPARLDALVDCRIVLDDGEHEP